MVCRSIQAARGGTLKSKDIIIYHLRHQHRRHHARCRLGVFTHRSNQLYSPSSIHQALSPRIPASSERLCALCPCYFFLDLLCATCIGSIRRMFKKGLGGATRNQFACRRPQTLVVRASLRDPRPCHAHHHQYNGQVAGVDWPSAFPSWRQPFQETRGSVSAGPSVEKQRDPALRWWWDAAGDDLCWLRGKSKARQVVEAWGLRRRAPTAWARGGGGSSK